MTPQESIAQSQLANEMRILVINQQIEVLEGQRERLEQLGHKLVDAMMSYDIRAYYALPEQRRQSE
jgi:hypothetical protein